MLLNRHNLRVSTLCGRDPGRYGLLGVHVTPAHTEASDGHCAGRVTVPLHDTEDFPPCAGIVDTSDPLTPCIIPRDAAERLAKAIPHTSSKPILRHARVDVASSNANGSFRAVTTDGETVQPIEARKVAVEFPDLDRVIPTGTPTLSVRFNAELLARVLKVAGAFNERSHAVRIDFTDDVSPVKITATDVATGQTGTFVIMPMRL